VNLHKVSDEVFVANEGIVRLGSDELALLKRQAHDNVRKRARICAHSRNEDLLHEMVIALAASTYIHPHKHIGKSESFHIIEGLVDIAVLDDTGELVDVVELGQPGLSRNFFYRLSESQFHTLLIKTDYLVVHEVTNGPFDPARSVLAPFAPRESDPKAAARYMSGLSQKVARYQTRVKP